MLWVQRRNSPGLLWSELTGEWPQPVWRTDQDLWYSSIYGEYWSAKTRTQTTTRNDASDAEIAAYKQGLIDDMLAQQKAAGGGSEHHP